MDTRLEITWRGSVPGLREHRLSLDAFGEALVALLSAYRRIASNMLRDAVIEGGLKDRRLNKKAKWLDLQLVQITEGSAGVSAVGVLETPLGQQVGLFEDLNKRAGLELLDSIESESQGVPRSVAVRKYLRFLPPGLEEHEYSFSSNGTTKVVKVGAVDLPPEPQDPSYLFLVHGSVISVGFEPGTPFVRFDTAEGKIEVAATPLQVDAALELRSGLVDALVVKGQVQRLLHLRKAGDEIRQLTAGEKQAVVFGQWEELLRRLAK
jgi:hypothetical protein